MQNASILLDIRLGNDTVTLTRDITWTAPFVPKQIVVFGTALPVRSTRIAYDTDNQRLIIPIELDAIADAVTISRILDGSHRAQWTLERGSSDQLARICATVRPAQAA